MPVRQIRTVSLSPELDRFVDEQVSSGYYASASEVVRAALRTLAQQQLPPARSNAQKTLG